MEIYLVFISSYVKLYEVDVFRKVFVIFWVVYFMDLVLDVFGILI